MVIGYFEPHGRADTIAKTDGLEIIPRASSSPIAAANLRRWTPTPSCARHPEICAVDEFPHTNIPGAERGKRWEDVMVLLRPASTC